MTKLAAIYRRFAVSTGGVAAIEFAVILPVLLLFLLATIDAGRAIGVYLKVRAATYTLDAIANQYTTIQATDMTSILGATAVVLSPYSASPVVVTISQMALTSSSTKVSWSATLNGTALTRGNPGTAPSAFAPTSSGVTNYVIQGVVSYTYTPMFIYFIKNAITLSDTLYVTPRSSKCIVYAPVSSSC